MAAKLIKLNNGKTIPQIGLGVYLTAKNEAKDIVYEALKVGYRHVDTAQFYQNEEEVAEGISSYIKDFKAKREDFFYTTKIVDSAHGYETAKKAIETSLERAKSIEYIDLLLIHSPFSNTEKRLATWKAMQEAVDSGKVKSIGVSNYGKGHLEELFGYSELKYRPVVNQIELHPWYTREDLVLFCLKNDILLEAYSPLARGNKFGDEYVVELSKKYNVSEAQILVKWSLVKGFITLPKTANVSRLLGNIDVYNFDLTEDEIAKLDAKDENKATLAYWDPANSDVSKDYTQ